MSWLAVTTKPNLEKGATAALDAKGLEAYLPTYRVRRRWSDRIKEIELPLFTGYTFCRPDPLRRVFPATGVTGIVHVGEAPALIADAEIEAVRRSLGSGLDVVPWPFVREGQQVEIVRGPLQGTQGIVIKIKEHYRLVISITMLQRSLSVEIDHDWACPR